MPSKRITKFVDASILAQFVIAVFCCVAVAVLCVLGWGRK